MTYIIQPMRYPAGHKEKTRERIVHAASRRFRKGGAGVGIQALMTSLKLTHGGFYRHFRSKDELFAEALEKSMEETAVRIARAAESAPGHELEAVIRTYLSEQHCSDHTGGCALPALTADVARQTPPVRATFDRALRRHAGSLARFVPGATEAERERRAMALLSGMAGALSTARAVSDDRMRRALLLDAQAMFLRAAAR
jgi:TetR/AcrR family transcriptional repressor of nem operon